VSYLQDLYQEMVMDHNSRPRNFRKLDDADRSLEGYNPLCGDRFTLYLKVDDGVISDIGFQGSGCAISRASTSMMTESVKGKSRAEAGEIFEAFHQMITRDPGLDFDDPDDKLGDLEILSGVSEFPVRVKCAVLSWHTLQAALEGREESVSTE
jgi:nitrogen fixation NifU-like protein